MAIFRKPSFISGGENKKLQIPGGLFQACPECGEVIHRLELAGNQRVCPKCEHHFAISVRERFGHLLDPESFEEADADLEPVDILEFRAASAYKDRLAEYQKRTGLKDSAIAGLGRVEGRAVAVAALDFSFLGGTLGSVAGEKITRNIETATARGLPVVIVSAAGGARLHEGMFALMQMAKTSGALALHARARLPFISVLTNPTTGGVIASFASLGDVILAEPRAMIGFRGSAGDPRDDASGPAAGFPDGGVPGGARLGGHDRGPAQDARDAGKSAGILRGEITAE